MPIKTHLGAREWALLLLLSLLWGGSFIFAEIALAALSPPLLVFARVSLAALALWVVVLLSGQRVPRNGRLWGCFALMGLLNNAIPFTLILWGQTQITAGLASILNATTPLFTVLVAHLLTRDEKLTPARLAGVVIGFGGVVVMIGPDLAGGPDADLWAQLAVLGAAVSYALAGVFGRRFRGLPPLVPAVGQLTFSALLMLPLLALVPLAQPSLLPGGVLLAVVALALLSTALAYLIYFRLLASAGATNLLLVTLLIPISALLLGWGLLGEQVEPGQLAGMAIIALGLAVLDGRLWALLGRGLGRRPIREV